MKAPRRVVGILLEMIMNVSSLIWGWGRAARCVLLALGVVMPPVAVAPLPGEEALTLAGRAYCHLCDDMLAARELFAQSRGEHVPGCRPAQSASLPISPVRMRPTCCTSSTVPGAAANGCARRHPGWGWASCFPASIA